MKMMMMISEIHHLGFCVLYIYIKKKNSGRNAYLYLCVHPGGLTTGVLETSAVRVQLMCSTCKTVCFNTENLRFSITSALNL